MSHATDDRPVYEGACAVCGWQMRRAGDGMRCAGCGARRPLPLDALLIERQMKTLPGFEELIA